MEEARFSRLGPLIRDVCREAVTIVGTEVDDIHLYAEVEEGSVFGAVFRMEETVIRYHSPTPELFKRLREAWLGEEPDKRWFVMQSEIYEGTFDATFEFPENFTNNEPATERCCREMVFRCRDDQELLYPPLAAYRERLRLTQRRNPTVKERIANTGFLMGIILGEAALLTGGEPSEMFIHAVIGDRWSSTSLYQDEGEHVRYHSTSRELHDLIYTLWSLDDPDECWSIMEMGTTNDQFDAFFLHPGEVDVEARDLDWRDIALKRRYGDKPIIYPPIPG